MSGVLTFPGDKMAELVQDNKTLLLVGDQGVYFMGEGKPKPNLIVYAEGCNPETDDFDDWWAKKGRTFGRDDGVEHIPAEDVRGLLEEGAVSITVALTPSKLSLGGARDPRQ